MERYRTIVRLEEIRKLYDNEEYEAAWELAEEIKTEKIKDMTDLFLLASVYRRKEEYEKAKRILLRIYAKRVSWRVLEELMDVCLAEKNPEEAREYLKVYAKLSNGDPRNYIYEYRIGRQLHRPDEELLPILQTLKAEEYSEKYGYELAKLYHKLGMREECEQECADLILWFGEGTYVERARMLQAYYRGEFSVEDIHAEAKKRIREAEARQARELEERRAYEARLREQERMAEEAGVPEEPQIDEVSDSFAAAAEEAADTEVAPMAEKAGDTAKAFLRKEEPSVKDGKAEAAKNAKMKPTGKNKKPGLGKHAEHGKPAAGEENAGSGNAAAVQESKAAQAVSEESAAVQENFPLSELPETLAKEFARHGVTLEEVLGAFAKIEEVRKQLLQLLEVMCFAHQGCHLLAISGRQGSGRTTLGRYMTRLFYELGMTKSLKIAKISAGKLNKINLEEKQEQLRGGCLIVENAGDMKEEAVRRLLDVGEKKKILSAVILEDTKDGLDRLFHKSKACAGAFEARVHLPEYGVEELVIFATEQFESHEYELDEGAKKALRELARQLVASGQEGSLEKILASTEKAIEAADHRAEGAILSMALQGKIQNLGATCIIAEDFKA